MAKKEPAGFNADARAQERTAGPVTIGKQVFTPAFKDWDVTNAEQDALTEWADATLEKETHQEAAQRLANEQIDTGEDKSAEISELTKQATAARVRADLAAYKRVALLLRDKDGEPADVEFLQKHLDVREINPLLQFLAGGESAGPTETSDTPT